MIQNPILRGFNPDPSICRVGDDYYIVTSTFEWMPGVQIHHSRDLKNWQLIGHALTRRSQIDLMGVLDSGGVWAPSLSYADGQFTLIYTNVRNCRGAFKDLHNYLITAPEILGPWSDPIFLNSSGFDASLFHDDDGRKWLVNVQWDHRKNRPSFSGIILQEYLPQDSKLVGPITKVLTKNELIEGPNLYKRDGWYYLMLAEGGTGYNHGISMARSRAITGPYEWDPQPNVMTARDDEAIELQKAGHGELVQTQSGEWYLAHLASRPIGEDRRCILGRETCLQNVTWSTDGWLRLEGGGTRPKLEISEPNNLPVPPWPAEPTRDEFNAKRLSPHWASLRVPMDESWVTLSQRPGWLRLLGRESLLSTFEQSFLGKRLQEFQCVAETCLEFAPTHYSQMAGLVCWYDTKTHYYLRVSHDQDLGKVLGIVLSDFSEYDELEETQIAINDWKQCYLRAVLNYESLQFFASPDRNNWQTIGPVLDATKLSDDYKTWLHFTGAFVGICAQDLGGTRTPADFDYFDLRPGTEPDS